MNDNDPNRSTACVAPAIAALDAIHRAKQAATRALSPRTPARLSPEQLDAAYRSAGIRNPRWRKRLHNVAS